MLLVDENCTMHDCTMFEKYNSNNVCGKLPFQQIMVVHL